MRDSWKVKDADSCKEGTSLLTLLAPCEMVEVSGYGNVDPGWRFAYVKIRSETKTLAGRVEAIKPGPGIVVMDPQLRQELDVHEGALVTLEPLHAEAAVEVEVALSEMEVGETELTDICRTYFEGQPLSEGQVKTLYLYSGKPFPAEIGRVSPSNHSVFTKNTKIGLSAKKAMSRKVRFADIGGMDHEIRILRERIIWPLRNRKFVSSMGIRIPRGFLFAGPPGCGKTLMARALSGELDVPCFEVRGPEVFAGIYGESEKHLRELFAKAREHAPSLLLIDEIDAIAPSRQSTRGDLERRIVTTLLTEMDGLHDSGDILVVGTTNEIDLLDSALRRPGRFDFELTINAPSLEGRLEILKIHSRHMPLQQVSFDDIAKMTNGFSGADLMNLCREAAFNALNRLLKVSDSENVDPTALRDTTITSADFECALKSLRPSALREFAVEVPSKISWDDVGGLEEVKGTIIEEVVRAISDPDTFKSMGIRPVKGVLFYGPPGTGKTLLARVIANQAGANFISVRGPEILSKWVGQSEQRVRQLFERARQVSPCIIFFDEIDALTASRGKGTNESADRVVNQLLTEMDGFQVGKQVSVMAATNRKDIIDPALLRPGRFDYTLEVPLPGFKARKQIFDIHLKTKPRSGDIDTAELAADSHTEAFSGAHIEEVCRRAAMEALRENGFDADGAKVTRHHLRNAIRLVRANIENLEKKVKIGF